MCEQTLKRLANTFFETDFGDQRGEEFFELDEDLQQYISQDKKMVIKIIEDSDSDFAYEDFPDIFKDLYQNDYDVWLARVLMREHIYEEEDFPIEIVDANFAIKSLISILGNEDQYWFRPWMCLTSTELFGNEKFVARILDIAEETAIGEPLIFWVFDAFKIEIFENKKLSSRIYSLIVKKISECTSNKITYFGGDSLYYYWNSLMHVEDFEEKMHLSKFDTEQEKNNILVKLKSVIKENIQMVEQKDGEENWFCSTDGFMGNYTNNKTYKTHHDLLYSYSPKAWMDYLERKIRSLI